VGGLAELSGEERARPYSKYYYMEFPRPPDMMELIRDPRPVDPAAALPIQRLNDMLNPGWLATETGYCVMPDGSGFVALNHKMPGVTAEMIRWWFAWFISEDLRYKIWFPRDHVGTEIKDEDRRMLADPSIPLERKLRNPGPGHVAIESVGAGVERIVIDFVGPDDFGFDMSRYHSPNVATTVCGNVVIPPTDPDGHPQYVVLLHFIRDIPGGVEYRSRFWMGYQIVYRKPVLMMPTGATVPEEACFSLYEHDVHENSRLAGFLPQLYREQGGKID
jgi:hypothetical protein